MRLYKTMIFILIILISVSLFSKQKIISLEKILKPKTISMDETQLYVTESDTKVLIFKKDNFKFIKKFGKKGEGPKEFMIFSNVTPLKDKLMINSLGKISFFTKDGNFINEIKGQGGFNSGFGFMPMGDGFVAQGRAGDEKGVYSVINYFDNNLNKVKELYRLKIAGKNLSKVDILRANVPYQVSDNAVFVPGEKGFLINAVDKNGKILFKIERKDYKTRKVTKAFKKKIFDILKKQNPQQYELLKNRIVFGEYFPPFSFFYKDQKAKMLYVFTWEFVETDFECFIYDMKGKFRKRVKIPFQMQGSFQPYPLTIYDWKVYQIIDNEETEEWELHITDVGGK